MVMCNTSPLKYLVIWTLFFQKNTQTQYLKISKMSIRINFQIIKWKNSTKKRFTCKVF